MKKLIKWDESLSIGSKQLDDEHKMLYDLANDLNNAVNMGANKQIIDTLFSMIINYAFQHFDSEEKCILDEVDFTRQCVQNYHMLKQLHAYALDYKNKRPLEREPGDFLEGWLQQHINESDFTMVHATQDDLTIIEEDVFVLDEFDVVEKDRRRFKRVSYEKIVDDQIIGRCYTPSNMKSSPVTVMDLAGGGLKIYSEKNYSIDDRLIISCQVGKNFNMKEEVKVRNGRDGYFGVEFVSPAKNTVKFLTEVCGAVSHHY